MSLATAPSASPAAPPIAAPAASVATAGPPPVRPSAAPGDRSSPSPRSWGPAAAVPHTQAAPNPRPRMPTPPRLGDHPWLVGVPQLRRDSRLLAVACPALAEQRWLRPCFRRRRFAPGRVLRPPLPPDARAVCARVRQRGKLRSARRGPWPPTRPGRVPQIHAPAFAAWGWQIRLPASPLAPRQTSVRCQPLAHLAVAARPHSPPAMPTDCCPSCKSLPSASQPPPPATAFAAAFSTRCFEPLAARIFTIDRRNTSKNRLSVTNVQRRSPARYHFPFTRTR